MLACIPSYVHAVPARHGHATLSANQSLSCCNIASQMLIGLWMAFLFVLNSLLEHSHARANMAPKWYRRNAFGPRQRYRERGPRLSKEDSRRARSLEGQSGGEAPGTGGICSPATSTSEAMAPMGAGSTCSAQAPPVSTQFCSTKKRWPEQRCYRWGQHHDGSRPNHAPARLRRRRSPPCFPSSTSRRDVLKTVGGLFVNLIGGRTRGRTRPEACGFLPPGIWTAEVSAV